MTHIQSRPATADDLAFAREVYFESQRWGIEQNFGWDEAREYEKFRRQFKPEETQIIMAGEQPIGWMQLEEKPDSIEVLGIYILDGWQKHGIGLDIMKSVLSRARAEDKGVLFNSSRIKRSKKLFERLGFYITHEQDHRFELRFGTKG